MKSITVIFFLFCGLMGLQAQISSMGLIAYYPFNGNANDASGNGKNAITINKAILTTDRNNKANSAYMFNGKDSYIQLPNTLDIPSKTISLWFNSFDQNTPCSLIVSDNADLNYGSIVVTSGKIQNMMKLSIDISSYHEQVMITANTWHYLAIIFYNNMVSYSLDGSPLKTYTNINYTHSGTGSENIIIGAGKEAVTQFYQGRIDDIRFYNRPLNPNEIMALFSEGKCFFNSVPVRKNSSICSNDSIYLEKKYRKTAGTYHDTIRSKTGCDSVITETVLTVNPTYFTSLRSTICNGDSVILGNRICKTAGVYSDRRKSVKGCDSIRELQLTVVQGDCFSISGKIYGKDNVPITGTVSLYSTTATSSDAPAREVPIINNSYRFDFVLQDQYVLLVNTNDQSFSPTYFRNKLKREDAFAIDVYGDVVKADVYLVFTANGIDESASGDSFSLFPNPASDLVQIRSSSPVKLFEIYNTLGETVLSTANTTVSMKDLPGGIYFYRVVTEKEIRVGKMIRE